MQRKMDYMQSEMNFYKSINLKNAKKSFNQTQELKNLKTMINDNVNQSSIDNDSLQQRSIINNQNHHHTNQSTLDAFQTVYLPFNVDTCRQKAQKIALQNSNQTQQILNLIAEVRMSDKTEISKLKEKVQKYKQIITSSTLKENDYESELRSLFVNSIQDSLKAFNIRRMYESNYSKLSCKKDYDESLELKDKFQIVRQAQQLSKSERISLMEKFLTSEKFLQIMEAQIFQKKCCQNMDCIYNIFQKPDQNLESYKYKTIVDDKLDKLSSLNSDFEKAKLQHLKIQSEKKPTTQNYHLQQSSKTNQVRTQSVGSSSKKQTKYPLTSQFEPLTKEQSPKFQKYSQLTQQGKANLYLVNIN